MDEKIGVYVCECGPNIPEKIDIDQIIEEIAPTEGVAVAKKFGLLCSNDGKKFLVDEIKKEGLTHLVIAACSPRDHESTFMKVCMEAGLNPYLFQMVNIREHCAWITASKEEATLKATRLIRAGINRVTLHKALLKKELDSIPDILVIGGGIAGIEASLSLSGPKRKVYLVERTDSLGGKALHLSSLLPHQGSKISAVKKKIQEIENNKHIELLNSSAVEGVRGFFGNFEVDIHTGGNGKGIREIKVGAIVVSTGFDLIELKKLPQYGYGEVENVLDPLEFEKIIASGNVLLKNGKPPQSVALVHCVGRNEVGYCSKVCCLYSIKFAHFLKDNLSGVEVTEIYQDLCLPNKADQEYFEQAKEKGVRFLRADVEGIKPKDGKIALNCMIPDGKKDSLTVDMVILAPAMVPSLDTSSLSSMLNIPLDKTGFYKEAHEKLNPVSSSIEGIFIAGCALGPKNISESIVQSQAASGKILSSLVPGKKTEPEVKVSEIREDLCTGCQTCLTVCCYGAISFDEFKGVSTVNEAICRGCGSCVGSCPSGAIRSKHFTYSQLYQEVLEAVR